MNMVYIIHYFPCCYDKILNKNKLEKCFNWVVWGWGVCVCLLVSWSEGTVYHNGVAWRWEQEVVGHMEFTVRKQREMAAGAQPTFSFLFSSGLQRRTDGIHIQVGRPHLSLPENTLADTAGCLPPSWS